MLAWITKASSELTKRSEFAMMFAGDDSVAVFDPCMETHSRGTAGCTELELCVQARVQRDRLGAGGLYEAGVTSRGMIRHCRNGPCQLGRLANADVEQSRGPAQDSSSSAQ
jgi:hypothetical protein